MIQYYSDKTKKFYDSLEDCRNAEIDAIKREDEEKKKKEKDAVERKEHAARVDAAQKTMIEARKKFEEELSSFCKKYGYYHTSLTESDIDPIDSLFDLFKFHL